MGAEAEEGEGLKGKGRTKNAKKFCLERVASLEKMVNQRRVCVVSWQVEAKGVVSKSTGKTADLEYDISIQTNQSHDDHQQQQQCM